jgi:ABC-type multidrug transport system fused ATPase/permease subunit
MGAFISLSTTLGVIFSSYYFENIDPGFAGLSIAYSLGFTDALLWVVRLHAMMEMEMNAVERIDEYMQLEQEPLASVPHHQPPHDWPAKGEIKVKELTLSYSAQMPPVLSKVSFEILAGEKVGIVGRTGY